MLARLATHRYTLRIALGALAAALLAYGLIGKAPATQRPAPPLPGRALSGRPVTLADLHGHAAVVLFFASWCPPCRQEAPAVAAFARSPAGHGHIVAIDYDDGGDWRAFLRRYDWTLPVLDDSSGETGAAFQIGHLPTVVFINADGRIASMRSGAQTVSSLDRGLAGAA
jgi:thiol-disulfide isomerase/thioredoxin